jgi:hypothetical protein
MTWLMEFGETCGGCGYTYDEAEFATAARAIRDGVQEFAQLVAARERPARDKWSPHEYACHLRDVLLVQRERVLQARREDTPAFPPMGRDERVEHDGYREQSGDAVVRQLNDAALMFANVLERLGPTDWQRTVMYNFPPPPRERSLKWVAAHTLHEVVHHTTDV